MNISNSAGAATRKCLTIKACLLFFFLPAIAAAAGDSEDQPRFGFSLDAEAPVIEMSVDIGLMRLDDPIPLLRIYGNGEAWIHYPVYMVKAGDYSLSLSPGAVEDLLTELEALGVFDFDAKAVKATQTAIEQQRREETLRQGQPLVLTNRSDDETTTIRVFLEWYQPRDRDEIYQDFTVRAAWHALQWEARGFPEIEALTGLARAAELLKTFTDHPELRRWQDEE